MANVLKPKRTSTAGKVPTTTDITNAGEIALNMADAKLYFRDGNSTIKELTVTTAQGVPFSGVTSKPTTLSGYGITDGATLSSTLPSNTVAPLIDWTTCFISIVFVTSFSVSYCSNSDISSCLYFNKSLTLCKKICIILAAG